MLTDTFTPLDPELLLDDDDFPLPLLLTLTETDLEPVLVVFPLVLVCVELLFELEPISYIRNIFLKKRSSACLSLLDEVTLVKLSKELDDNTDFEEFVLDDKIAVFETVLTAVGTLILTDVGIVIDLVAVVKYLLIQL